MSIINDSDIKKMLECEEKLMKKEEIFNKINLDKEISEFLKLKQELQKFTNDGQNVSKIISNNFNDLKKIDKEFNDYYGKLDEIIRKEAKDMTEKDIKMLDEAEIIKITEFEKNMVKLQKQIEENLNLFLELAKNYKETDKKLKDKNMEQTKEKITIFTKEVKNLESSVADIIESMSKPLKDIYVSKRKEFEKNKKAKMIIEWDISNDEKKALNKCLCGNLSQQERDKIMVELSENKISSCSTCNRLIVKKI